MKKILSVLFLLASVCFAQAQIVNTLPFQLQNGTTADATQVMADFNQIVNNVNSSAAKNGANSDITSLTGLTTPLAPGLGGSSVYTAGASTGTANAQIIASPSPSGFTLVQGKRVVFLAGATNTGAMTLNVASSGAVNVFYPTPSGPLALIGGEVRSGNLIEVVYDGTQYQLVTNNLSLLGPLTSLASAATADLGTVATHNVNITGAVTISSFGSSASTAYPIYYLTFVSTPTLTYNATSMILPGSADIVVAAGDTAVAQYLGSGNWKIWSYQRLSGTAVIGVSPLANFNKLVITNNAGTPNTQIDVTATNALMANSSGGTVTRSSVSFTINLTTGTVTSTANGMDGETRPASGFVYLYMIDNGTTTAGLASTSSTSPTLPSGYTFSGYIGAMPLTGSNLFGILQKGRDARYKVGLAQTTAMQLICGNSQGDPTIPTWASKAVGSFIPTTATSIALVGDSNNGNITIVAPSSSYGAYNSTTNPPPLVVQAATSFIMTVPYTMQLESTNIFCATQSGTGSLVWVNGWKDAVNAN